MARYDPAAIQRAADAAIARQIIEIGRQRGLGEDFIIAALSGAIVESNVRNVNYGDRDSLGVYQQRPSQGWGSPQQVTTPSYAINTFYDRLQRTPRRNTLGLWVQAVQRSAYPGRYDEAMAAARHLYNLYGGKAGGGGLGTAPGTPRVPGQAGTFDANALAESMLRDEENAGPEFDPRAMLTSMLTGMSRAVAARAGAGDPSQPLETAIDQEIAAPGQQMGANPDELQGEMPPPMDEALTPEELLQALTGGEPLADVEGDVQAQVNSLLEPGQRRVDEEQRRKRLAELQAQLAQQQADAAGTAASVREGARQTPGSGGQGPGGPGGVIGGSLGPPSSLPFDTRGMRPNALRAAQLMRQAGFTGTMHGFGKRNNPTDHDDGNAWDFMVGNNSGLGDWIAQYHITNRDALGVKYVIWRQRIASASTGWQWRPMGDRGSPTANHMDHPHVSYF